VRFFTVSSYLSELETHKSQNLRLNTLLVSFILAGSSAVAQNYSIYSSYFLNPYVYNPAEAATERMQFFAGYRQQWTGITDAPKVLFITGTTLLNDTRAGLGLRANTISRGFLMTSEASFSYAYGVPLNKTSKMYFGLSGGMVINGINWEKVSDPSDPALANISNSTIPSGSFGMLYRHASGFNFGVSLPKMFTTVDLGQEFTFAPVDNVVVMAYYRKEPPKKSTAHPAAFKKKKKKGSKPELPFEVYTLYRYSDLGGQFEVTGKLNVGSSIWAAATYRQNSGFIPGIGLNMGTLSLSYFYELGSKNDLSLTSHEVLLGLRIGAPNRFRENEPPVVAARPSTITPPKPAAPKPAETKPVETKPAPVETKPVPVAAATTAVATAAPIAESPTHGGDSVAMAAAHAAERAQLDAHLEDHADGSHDDAHNHPVNERHEFVKRGTHHEELDEGTHVIAGAFQSRANAEHYTASLKKLGFDADFGHLSVRNLWYVFISHDTEIEQAKAERNVLQKNKMFKDVWLLTVHQ